MKSHPITLHDDFDIYDYYQPPFYHDPLLLSCLVGSILIVLIILVIMIKRWRKTSLLPHEWALIELKKLSPDIGTDKHAFKIFYFKLTKILKEYLVKRYELNIMAKTDEELIEYLEDRKFDPSLIAELKKIHSNALLVKFANQEIIKTQAEKDLALAHSFIEETKPKQNHSAKKS